MIKYVRTKCKIYPVCQAEDRWKELGYRLVGSEIVLIPYNDIIKEADTIEELCDEFVYVEYNKPRVLNKVITREIKEKGIKVAETIYCHPNWNGIIYGAIWTDNGLIYVAKLNEEGELELI